MTDSEALDQKFVGAYDFGQQKFLQLPLYVFP